MKKVLLLLTLAIVLLSAVSMHGMETKFKMELWNRYTADIVDRTIEESQFALKRGYFRLEPEFTDNIKGRFNLDFFSDEDGLDGAGLKLKYAYLDFNKLLPIPESKVTFGLMKNYFGTIYTWDYTTIDKDPSDKYKVISSTDYGLGYYALIPGGFGEYSLQMSNGEGYKKTGGDVDINPAFIGNLRVIPIPGITVGGSVYYTQKGLLNSDELLTAGDTTVMAAAGLAKISFGPLSLIGEYLMKNIDSDGAYAYMGMGSFSMGKISGFDMDIVARYDKSDPDKDTADDGSQMILGGINYYILRASKNSPAVWLQANYSRTMYEDATIDDVDEIALQLRWVFSHTIN
ncbi:MAG: hypothetical protein SVK54_02890 [candidate division WOR-3 bacterium]|nr:hypothetical protein [candidate division WOR-3 bacterium]